MLSSINSVMIRKKMQEIVKQFPFKESYIDISDNRQTLKIKLQLKNLLEAYQFEGSLASIISECYETPLQSQTPLQYFISAMKTTSIKRTPNEIEDLWECSKLLLLNGALPHSNSLHVVHEFRKIISDHIANEDLILMLLQFFLTSLDCNYNKIAVSMQRSIITYNLYDNRLWIMSDANAATNIDKQVCSPKLLEFYLQQEYDFLYFFHNEETYTRYDYCKMRKYDHKMSYKTKQSIVRRIITENLKNKRSFAKYLLPFRECSKQFRLKKVKEFDGILAEVFENEIVNELGNDVIDAVMCFVYDDMSYLKYDSLDEDRDFVNESLKMYDFLSNKWKTWIFNNYILKLPKDELAKLDSFAYMCYL